MWSDTLTFYAFGYPTEIRAVDAGYVAGLQFVYGAQKVEGTRGGLLPEEADVDPSFLDLSKTKITHVTVVSGMQEG